MHAQCCPPLCDSTDCGRPGSSAWDSPGKNAGVGCHFPFQGIFLIQRWNLRLFQILHGQEGSFLLVHGPWRSVNAKCQLHCCCWSHLYTACALPEADFVPFSKFSVLTSCHPDRGRKICGVQLQRLSAITHLRILPTEQHLTMTSFSSPCSYTNSL